MAPEAVWQRKPLTGFDGARAGRLQAPRPRQRPPEKREGRRPPGPGPARPERSERAQTQKRSTTSLANRHSPTNKGTTPQRRCGRNRRSLWRFGHRTNRQCLRQQPEAKRRAASPAPGSFCKWRVSDSLQRLEEQRRGINQAAQKAAYRGVEIAKAV